MMSNKGLKNILTAAFLLVFGALFGATVYGQNQLAGTWKEEKDGANIKRFEMQINDEGLIIYSNLRWQYPFVGDYPCDNPVNLLLKPVSNGAIYDTGCWGVGNVKFTIEANRIVVEIRELNRVNEIFNLKRIGSFNKQKINEAKKAVEEADRKVAEAEEKVRKIRGNRPDPGKWIGSNGENSLELTLNEKSEIAANRIRVKHKGSMKDCSDNALLGKPVYHTAWYFFSCDGDSIWIEFQKSNEKFTAKVAASDHITFTLERPGQSQEKPVEKSEEKPVKESDEETVEKIEEKTDEQADKKTDETATNSIFEGSWSGSANVSISEDGKESESELNVSDLTIKNANDLTYAFDVKIGGNTVQCSNGANPLDASLTDPNTLKFSFNCGNLAFDAELKGSEEGLTLEIEGKEDEKNLTIEKATVNLSRKK